MPPWALDAKIELTGSQLLQLDQTDQVYEKWEGLSDSADDSDGGPDSHPSHDPSPQPVTNSAHDDASDPGDEISNSPSGAIPPSTTIEGLQEAINTWAVDHGFAVIRGQGRCSRTKAPAKDYISYHLFCHRFGQPQESTATMVRSCKTPSRKCGCKWMAVARKHKTGGLWHFFLHDKAVHREHNHGQAQHPAAPTPHRRLKPEVIEAIKEAAELNGMTPRAINDIIRRKFPGSAHTMKHIYNARERIRRRNLNGSIATDAGSDSI
ncbi:hypothetical protein SMACR_08970 [Sordaria macrospora]|uniref:WGS project CABT00000000 data, contig 2.82 n=2 Tax=Sordaria macrospora TaxID=5147 RepID=F7WBQ4_SORMK|nr:uncharacterized protein SMAC_08970 [Sordaria macrospora k-hell]KAA8624231.1 hypothetical protein SMACR_08970 [Sordaria macrospora]WPJ67242.1 hypothetical protein SMAC4_08970 [Sordaria macrospora]CCC05469.1 unnamed protein product [Sordaria macrospora k-hell]